MRDHAARRHAGHRHRPQLACARSVRSPWCSRSTGALADWRARTQSFVLLVGAAGLVLSGISTAYFWQAWRARARRPDLRQGPQAPRHRALARPLRAVGLGPRARHDLLVGFDVRDARLRATRASSCPSARSTASSTPRTATSIALADMLGRREATTSTTCSASAPPTATGSGCGPAPSSCATATSRDPHLIGIAIDITEQRRLAEETATADMRLRDAIETISEAFVLWDAENRLVMCNSKFQQLHNLRAGRRGSGHPLRGALARR